MLLNTSCLSPHLRPVVTASEPRRKTPIAPRARSLATSKGFAEAARRGLDCGPLDDQGQCDANHLVRVDDPLAINPSTSNGRTNPNSTSSRHACVFLASRAGSEILCRSLWFGECPTLVAFRASATREDVSQRTALFRSTIPLGSNACPRRNPPNTARARRSSSSASAAARALFRDPVALAFVWRMPDARSVRASATRGGRESAQCFVPVHHSTQQ